MTKTYTERWEAGCDSRPLLEEADREIERLNLKCSALAVLLYGPNPNAAEPGVVYRKWPGEPPHCMSCDCGMTEEQKKTVPFEDYQRIHKELMDLKYPGSSPEPASREASQMLMPDGSVRQRPAYLSKPQNLWTEEESKTHGAFQQEVLRMQANAVKSRVCEHEWEIIDEGGGGSEFQPPDPPSRQCILCGSRQ